MTDDEASKAFWATCLACHHNWIAAYYPMNLTKFAKIAMGHSVCPKCGKPGSVAKQKDGELLMPEPKP